VAEYDSRFSMATAAAEGTFCKVDLTINWRF